MPKFFFPKACVWWLGGGEGGGLKSFTTTYFFAFLCEASRCRTRAWAGQTIYDTYNGPLEMWFHIKNHEEDSIGSLIVLKVNNVMPSGLFLTMYSLLGFAAPWKIFFGKSAQEAE